MRATAAETARHKAELEVHSARGTVQETNLHLVTNAIDTLRQSNEIAKANYKAAMLAGDYDAAATYQEDMTNHAAKLLQLDQGKQVLENTPLPVAPVQRSSDPIEAFASQLSSRSAEWVRRHPQFVTDPRLNQKMIAAHNMAMADGHVADSNEYFATVETLLQVSTGEAMSEACSRDDAEAVLGEMVESGWSETTGLLEVEADVLADAARAAEQHFLARLQSLRAREQKSNAEFVAQRVASLEQSYRKDREKTQELLTRGLAAKKDERYLRMMRGKLANREADYSSKKAELNNLRQVATEHEEVAAGVLEVV